jgi:DNA-binding FadR family transcriptional regulator
VVEKSQRGHEEIYEAIANGDAGAAREAMRRHVEQFEKDIHANLSVPDAW